MAKKSNFIGKMSVSNSERKRKAEEVVLNALGAGKSKKADAKGRVKVAKYFPGKPMPKAPPGYRNILIHTSEKRLGGALSPYLLCNEKGQLLENVWQFAKIYRRVLAQRTAKSRFQPNEIIWEHPEEQHIDEERTILPAYWAWRRKGMSNSHAVRYPNGFKHRAECVACLWMVDGKLEWLDYIAARKHVYCGEYARLAPPHPEFKKLQALLQSGVNLQIVEVDGPDPQLDFYPYDALSSESPGLDIDEKVIRALLNDDRKPFGHGYVLAALLLGGSDWLKP